MITYRIPAGFELIGMTTATGELSWVVLHLRNRETGLDELTRVMAASIPDMADSV